tara:strand:- start:192 stop:827 length:636 start_codon:yes stop_codon:yes gene_type:complete
MKLIKRIFGFGKTNELDEDIAVQDAESTGSGRREFITKGLMGVAGIGGLALAAKTVKAGGIVFNDGSSQTAGASGKVLQVVEGTYSTETNTSSSTYADTGLTATITPSSTSSKILVCANQAGLFKYTGDTYGGIKLLRDSTQIALCTEMCDSSDTSSHGVGATMLQKLDSPSTTSSITYKTQFKVPTGTGTLRLSINSSVASIVAMEIDGT